MKKAIKKDTDICVNVRDSADKVKEEFYSHDKNNAFIELSLNSINAEKVTVLFHFKKTNRFLEVVGTVEANHASIPFDTSMITTDETVTGFVYAEKDLQSADLFRFSFGVRVSEIDKLDGAPVIEKETKRIVAATDIVTKSELEEALKHIKVEGADGAQGIQGERGPQGDIGPQGLQGERGQDGQPGPRGERGEQGPAGLPGPVGPQGPIGPRGENGRDGVGIPQKISLAGNTLILSDGGGSVTLPANAPANTSGQVSEYEIHGVGMPNGKVAAPVGTTYVDTVATNKALKWIKRFGSDNQGWEVLKGDTGWINLPIVSKLGASYLKIRRVNNMVTYQFGGLSWGWFGIVRRGGPGYVLQPSDRDRNVFILGLGGVPVGFRSEFSLIGGIYNDAGTPYGTWYLGGSGDGNMLRFQFTDPVPTNKDIGDIRVSSIMYLTDEPWPTRLP